MKDIQNQIDTRQVDIRKVGIKTVSHPIVLLDKKQSRQYTVATVNMYVNLPHNYKGTHMSRFMEILGECHGEIDLSHFYKILEKMKERLQAEASHLEMFFPYFLQRDNVGDCLPVKYDCSLKGSLTDEIDLQLSLSIPLFAGNGQKKSRWGVLELLLRFSSFVWIEDIIGLVEERLEKSSLGVASADTEASAIAATVGDALAAKKEIVHYCLTVRQDCDGYSSFAQLSL